MFTLLFVFADGAATLSSDGFVGFLVLGVAFVSFLSLVGGGKTLKCKKCGFTTSDDLRAAGHVATENTHKCEEV